MEFTRGGRAGDPITVDRECVEVDLARERHGLPGLGTVCAAEQANTELLVVPSAGKSQLVSAVSAEECCALCGRTPAYEAWSWCEPARGETMGRCTLTVLSLSPVEAEQLGQNSRLHSNERCQTGFQHLTVKGNGGEPTRVLCRRVSVVLGSIRAQKRLWWTGGGRG